MTLPPEPEPEASDSSLSVKAAAILGAVFVFAAVSLYGTRTAASVAMGALIAIANLLTMRALIRALLRVPPPTPDAGTKRESSDGDEGAPPAPPPADDGPGWGGAVAWSLFAVFKILVLFGGIWILLTRGLVDPMPLVVGYGVLPLGIAGGALWSSYGPRRPRR